MAVGHAAATVIASQAALDEGVLEGGRLEQLAAAAQLRLRRAAGTPADLMVSKAGSTLPFLLWRGSGGERGGGDSRGKNAAHILRLAGTFKQVYVLLSHKLLGNAAVLDAVSRLSVEESLTFVWMPMGACFTEQALALAQALLPAEAEEVAWRKQQTQMVQTSEAANQALLGLPLPQDGDAVHHANELRMLGSISDISQRRGDEIAAHTSMDCRTAAAIAAFFQRGARQEAPVGLGLPPQLYSL